MLESRKRERERRIKVEVHLGKIGKTVGEIDNVQLLGHLVGLHLAGHPFLSVHEIT